MVHNTAHAKVLNFVACKSQLSILIINKKRILFDVHRAADCSYQQGP